MSDNPPIFKPSLRQPLLQKLRDEVKEMGFYGKIEGNPALPECKHALSLNKIARIQIMMNATEEARLSLELGANPNYTARDISQLQLAKAFAAHYGEDMVQQLKEYGATHKHKKTSPKKSQ